MSTLSSGIHCHTFLISRGCCTVKFHISQRCDCVVEIAENKKHIFKILRWMSDIDIDMRTHNERVCELSGAQIGALYYLPFVLQPQCDMVLHTFFALWSQFAFHSAQSIPKMHSVPEFLQCQLIWIICCGTYLTLCPPLSATCAYVQRYKCCM